MRAQLNAFSDDDNQANLLEVNYDDEAMPLPVNPSSLAHARNLTLQSGIAFQQMHYHYTNTTENKGDEEDGEEENEENYLIRKKNEEDKDKLEHYD